MNTLLLYMGFNSITALVIFSILYGYLYVTRFRIGRKFVFFFSGLLVLITAISLPSTKPADSYHFSLHMTSHVLLLLVAAPLMVAGIPIESRCKNMLQSVSRKSAAVPVLNWFAGVGIMWFWHIPAVYHYMMGSHSVISGQLTNPLPTIYWLSMWISGVIFCWPLIGPYKQYNLPALKGVLYLSTACIACSLLGLLITFSPAGLYDDPAIMKDMNMRSSDIAVMDQQTAGLIMWVPCCFIYLAGAMILLKRWFDGKENSPAQTGVQLLKDHRYE